MKLPITVKSLSTLLLFQAFFWYALTLGLYHTGHTPYWFDNQVQASNWTIVMGNKTHSPNHKHSPFTDNRYENFETKHIINFYDGLFVGKTATSNIETWNLKTNAGEQKVEVYYSDKTKAACGSSKLAQIRRLNCYEDELGCLDKEFSCGNSDLEVIQVARPNDSVLVKNVYKPGNEGQRYIDYTKYVYIR